MTKSIKIRESKLIPKPKPARDHVANDFTLTRQQWDGMVRRHAKHVEEVRERWAVAIFVVACAFIVFAGGFVFGGGN